MTSRVLIIEDVISFRELITTYLRINGYNVVEAATLEAARRVIPLVRPDMILLDLHLADGEGLAILRDDIGCDAPVIVVSGRADAASRVESLELGAADFMVKPIDPRELLLRMRRAGRPAGAHRFDEVRELNPMGRTERRRSARQPVLLRHLVQVGLPGGRRDLRRGPGVLVQEHQLVVDDDGRSPGPVHAQAHVQSRVGRGGGVNEAECPAGETEVGT